MNEFSRQPPLLALFLPQEAIEQRLPAISQVFNTGHQNGCGFTVIVCMMDDGLACLYGGMSTELGSFCHCLAKKQACRNSERRCKREPRPAKR